MKTMTLTDHQMQQLRCWKAFLEVNGGHTFSDEEVLARVLAACQRRRHAMSWCTSWAQKTGQTNDLVSTTRAL